MFIPKLNSKCVFKYHFDGGKKLSLAECFERNKIALFCLFSYCRFNFYQCFANQRLAFYYKKEEIKATQTKPERTQNCSKVQKYSCK